jgi:hypothetical protein
MNRFTGGVEVVFEKHLVKQLFREDSRERERELGEISVFSFTRVPIHVRAHFGGLLGRRCFKKVV